MTEAWDTTVASRIAPGNRYAHHLLERAAAGDPVGLTAPTVLEVSYGLALSSQRDKALKTALAWFTRLVSGDLVEIYPLDAAAAVVAGRLRSEQPIPPTTGKRHQGSKSERRVGWLLDIQIAACAWTHGAAVKTENVRDFNVLAGLIESLYPGTTRLHVDGSPELTVDL